MEHSYTEKMEDSLFRQWSIDEEDYSGVRAILGSEFRTFGEGLLDIMTVKYGAIDDPIAFIRKEASERGVLLSAIGSLNTLKNWFHGGPRPKKGDATRQSMFALAFALNLSIDETKMLFHKVYLDRAFDFRETLDIVVFYCLSHNRTWDDVQSLLMQTGESVVDDHTVYTQVLKDRVSALSADLELIDFLQRHQHNLSKKNVTAKQQLEELLLKANAFAQKELESTAMEEQFKGSDRSSNSFTYEMIIGISPSGEKGTISLFKHAALPKEIRNRFPEAASFSKKNPTYEELRKMIILLYSYIFWYQVQQQHCQIDLDDYIAEMNAMMTECGFSELYMGNPYDWMFMYCTLNEQPLDTFRGLMLEVLEQE